MSSPSPPGLARAPYSGSTARRRPGRRSGSLSPAIRGASCGVGRSASATRCRETRRRSRVACRSGRGSAARAPDGLGRRDRSVVAGRVPPRSGGSAPPVPGRGDRLGARGHARDALRRDDRFAPALDGADSARPRAARRDERGAPERALPGPAADRGRAGIRGARAAARPRPARAVGPVRAPVGARGRAGDPARADPGAGRSRARRGAARARGGGDGPARTGANALAVTGGLARTGTEPRRGGGGPGVRPAGGHARTAARLDEPRPGCVGGGRASGRDRSAVALATAQRLSFSYPGAPAALRDVCLKVEPGEVVALFGPSGSGKSTLLRALGGLVPHFHGGRFSGRVEVAGCDTRTMRPAELAGTVATLFQDPEDQVVFTRVGAEVAFGLENVGVAPTEIEARALAALDAVGAAHLAERPVAQLSGGELQRVCLASVLALRPRLLLLDEPTSQLDPDGAAKAVELARGSGAAVVVSEQRPDRVLDACDRVLFLERGLLELDVPRDGALAWLARNRPAWVPRDPELPASEAVGDPLCRLRGASFR